MTDENKRGNDKSDSNPTVDKNLTLGQAKNNAEKTTQDKAKSNKTNQQSKENISTKSYEVETKKSSKVKEVTKKVKMVSKEKIENKKPLFNAKAVPKMEATKTRKTNLFSVIIFILLFLLLSISAWMFYQQQLANESLQTIKNKINQDLSIQNSKIESVVKANASSHYEINQINQSLISLANQNNDLKLQLLSAQEKIKSLSGRRKQDWMLAEVEYLINIAELKLSLQKDRNTAIQLLKAADERIIEISDRSLLPIREAIARDISNLRLIQESDITGIVITLNTLDQEIAKLALLAFKFDEGLENKTVNTQAQETNEGEEQSESYLSGFSEIYKRFVKEFIVIKNHAETPQPLMTPKQRGNLNRNIQLVLQQAQIAAQQGNEKLYLLNINKATNWIVEYFGQGAETNPIIKQLETLRAEKIDVRYPSKLESSTAIELANKDQLYNWLDNSLNPADQKNEISVEATIDDTKLEDLQKTKEANKQ